ncbi:MAG: 4-hydroxy-tetrahydrodipicolinate synthase [Planctomycetota bacterium]|jgi:4-hydroxy-tetrahydrodipicolinate synthase|nr:4-hydroxy-tetrahydrodipicolinate synthase [Planctomycetota bacterium]
MFFSGSYVALVTPWTKDLSGIDYGALKDLIEWHIASGTDGILPAGTTGESATLTHSEQHRLIEETVKSTAGRAKVLAGAGSNSTAEAVSLADHAKRSGADGILAITPYYNRPTPEGLYRHFGTVAENCDLPMMIYNVPGRTGTNILPATVARIARDYPSVVCIKESSGIVDQSSQIIALTDDGFSVMSGDDSLALPIMAVGGSGVVSVIANIVPAETKRMTAAALAGDFMKARELHYHLLPLMKACFVETNPAPAKTALRIMGKLDGGMRLPMVPLQPESEAALLEALRKVGLVG